MSLKFLGIKDVKQRGNVVYCRVFYETDDPWWFEFKHDEALYKENNISLTYTYTNGSRKYNTYIHAQLYLQFDIEFDGDINDPGDRAFFDFKYGDIFANIKWG